MLSVFVRGLGLSALLLGLAVSPACGDDDAQPMQTPPKQRMDAGDTEPEEDAGLALPRKDAGTEPTEPGMPDPGLDGACAIDSNKIFTLAERDRPFSSTPLAVDPINSQFALPFVASGDCLDAVHMTTFAGAATSGAPKSAVAIDACSLVRNAVTTAVGDSWLVALVDNREPPYDVWVEPYDAAKGKMGAGQRITQGSSVETALALTTLRDGEHAMLAWSDEDRVVGQSLSVRPLDKTGMPSGAAVRIEESKTLYYHGLAIKALGADGAGLAYWRYSDDFTTSDVVFVALDASGKPLREAWVLAANAGPSAGVDLAIDENGGGIVFARAEAMTGRQLWFQQIDDSGEAALIRGGPARAPALRFVNAPFKGIDVSVAKLSTSYAVAYRALPAVNQTQAQIRLYFLDRFGAVIGNSDVSFTSASGGRTAIQTAYDGRVVVGWSQVDESGKSSTKVVRLPCVGG